MFSFFFFFFFSYDGNHKRNADVLSSVLHAVVAEDCCSNSSKLWTEKKETIRKREGKKLYKAKEEEEERSLSRGLVQTLYEARKKRRGPIYKASHHRNWASLRQRKGHAGQESISLPGPLTRHVCVRELPKHIDTIFTIPRDVFLLGGSTFD